MTDVNEPMADANEPEGTDAHVSTPSLNDTNMHASGTVKPASQSLPNENLDNNSSPIIKQSVVGNGPSDKELHGSDEGTQNPPVETKRGDATEKDLNAFNAAGQVDSGDKNRTEQLEVASEGRDGMVIDTSNDGSIVKPSKLPSLDQVNEKDKSTRNDASLTLQNALDNKGRDAFDGGRHHASDQMTSAMVVENETTESVPTAGTVSIVVKTTYEESEKDSEENGVISQADATEGPSKEDESTKENGHDASEILTERHSDSDPEIETEKDEIVASNANDDDDDDDNDDDDDPFAGLEDIAAMDLYEIGNYTFGKKDSRSGCKALSEMSPRAIADSLRREYAQRGMRRSVRAVMLVHEHNFPHVLLLQRSDGRGEFMLPGGRLRPGESFEQGLERKLKSKLGRPEVAGEDDVDGALEIGDKRKMNALKMVDYYSLMIRVLHRRATVVKLCFCNKTCDNRHITNKWFPLFFSALP